MKNYEIMIIVRPTLGEDEIKEVVKNFEEILTSNGAEITDFQEMGKRTLAYEIKKNNSGYYFVYNVQSNDDKAIKEFDRLALINNDIIRHLIIKKDK